MTLDFRFFSFFIDKTQRSSFYQTTITTRIVVNVWVTRKPRDARRILKDKDLLISAIACPELKAFLNRILQLCEGDLIP